MTPVQNRSTFIQSFWSWKKEEAWRYSFRLLSNRTLWAKVMRLQWPWHHITCIRRKWIKNNADFILVSLINKNATFFLSTRASPLIWLHKIVCSPLYSIQNISNWTKKINKIKTTRKINNIFRLKKQQKRIRFLWRCWVYGGPQEISYFSLSRNLPV